MNLRIKSVALFSLFCFLFISNLKDNELKVELGVDWSRPVNGSEVLSHLSTVSQ